MAYSCLNAAILMLLIFSVSRAKAQISTACTGSIISSFTPCINYVTGSTATGSSPTEDCCNSVKSLLTDNVDCVCLIVTGNVPVSIPFLNSTLALSLPQACKSSVPLQCKATGIPLPPAGPVLFGPPPAPAPATPPPRSHSRGPTLAPAPHSHGHGSTLAPAPHSHSHSRKASKAANGAAPPPVEGLDVAPAAASPKFALGPSANPGIRPVFNPNSASAPSAVVSLPLPALFMLLAGIVAFNCF